MMTMGNKVSLLDCTLRDGGYHNNWKFSKPLVENYLKLISASPVTVCEIGFKSLIASSDYGIFARCPESFLDSIIVDADIAVMVNVAEFRGLDQTGVYNAFYKLFPREYVDSKISIIRFAVHASDVDILECLVPLALTKGYKFGINCMVFDHFTVDILEKVKCLAEDKASFIYFADSFGSMGAAEIEQCISKLSVFGDGVPLGFHSHDNRGLALSNVLKSLELGIGWIDSTFSGMGRGAGNVCTEDLLIELYSHNDIAASLQKDTLEFVHEFMMPMKRELGWGVSPTYRAAAHAGIHPSFVQQIENNHCYDRSRLFEFVRYCDKNDVGVSYDESLLEGFFHVDTMQSDASIRWGDGRYIADLTDTLSGKPVMVVGASINSDYDCYEIQELISQYDPIVMTLNATEFWLKSAIRIISNPMRALSLNEKTTQGLEFLVGPAEALSLVENVEEYGIKVIRIEAELQEKAFGCGVNDGCLSAKVPNQNVFSYALSILTLTKISELIVAGISMESAHEEALSRFELSSPNANVSIITVSGQSRVNT